MAKQTGLASVQFRSVGWTTRLFYYNGCCIGTATTSGSIGGLIILVGLNDMKAVLSCWEKNTSLLFVLAIVLVVQQNCSAQDNLPFDVFGDAIDSQLIGLHLESQGKKLLATQAEDAVEQLRKQLKSVGDTSKIERASLANAGVTEKDKLYRHMVKSSLYLGELYDCGRCDRSHPSYSGGVVVSEDGLALTNYHVIAGQNAGQRKTECFMAMTYDGKCFAVEEVLAASQVADVALVRLKADGHKFHAAPIASSPSSPMDSVRIISNPSGHFFVLTRGEVSRYSRVKEEVFMEITADFGGGSSGSGVFNDRGEVVGLVSRIFPIFQNTKKRVKGTASTVPYVPMSLKRCVRLQEIHNCFEDQKSETATVPTTQESSAPD